MEFKISLSKQLQKSQMMQAESSRNTKSPDSYCDQWKHELEVSSRDQFALLLID